MLPSTITNTKVSRLAIKKLRLHQEKTSEMRIRNRGSIKKKHPKSVSYGYLLSAYHQIDCVH